MTVKPGKVLLTPTICGKYLEEILYYISTNTKTDRILYSSPKKYCLPRSGLAFNIIIIIIIIIIALLVVRMCIM